MKTCPNCQTKAADSAFTCPACYRMFSASEPQPKRDSKRTAILIAAAIIALPATGIAAWIGLYAMTAYQANKGMNKAIEEMNKSIAEFQRSAPAPNR